jgi:hypothetical protein
MARTTAFGEDTPLTPIKRGMRGVIPAPTEVGIDSGGNPVGRVEWLVGRVLSGEGAGDGRKTRHD